MDKDQGLVAKVARLQVLRIVTRNVTPKISFFILVVKSILLFAL